MRNLIVNRNNGGPTQSSSMITLAAPASILHSNLMNPKHLNNENCLRFQLSSVAKNLSNENNGKSKIVISPTKMFAAEANIFNEIENSVGKGEFDGRKGSLKDIDCLENELNSDSAIEQLDSQEFSLQQEENDDLVTLNNLNECVVLEQLKSRFCKNKIYTYIGDILVAMNPLKALSIYSKEVSSIFQKSENFRANLPPHVFATAEQCFREMIRTQQSQSILISGESGSGKTETCKYLVQHLLTRTKPFEICLNDKIQEVNPLLEAFGNARTRINDNSSRFGKYLEIYFEQDGTVVGAKFKEYLLEKSRIVYQNKFESTFHIFYLLFAGLSDEEKLRYNLLRSPRHFRFMSNMFSENCISAQNEQKYFTIRQSMDTIGFSNEDVENLIKILISILLIGEIQFVQKKNSNYDAVEVNNMEVIHNVCELLELDANEFSDALVSEVQITRGEEIKRERNMVQVCDVRDAFAKALYGRLFSWIVNQINHHIQPPEGVMTECSIGLLDIFGFENFEKNSFEQMCINLANEQLHQLFTTYIFKLEIQECLDEQIELSNSDLVNFQDNQIILDLFLEKRTGIFALLDEESRFPKANDQSLAIKLHQTLSSLYSSDVYVAPKNVGTTFSIVHYAGQVLYSVEGFLEKNRDFLPNNVFYAARNSYNPLVQELFQCKLTRKGTLAPSDRQSRLRKSMANSPSNEDIQSSNFLFGPKASIVKFATSSITSSATSMNSDKNSFNSTYVKNFHNFKADSINSHQNQYSSEKSLPLTVACHFKNSLHELIDKINKCKPYFIRCIKPSPNQQSLFIKNFVIKQLRYCSIMHVCKIRKCGFPFRVKFDEFLKWYKAIEICVVKKNESTATIDCNNNIDGALQRCLKCLEYANISNFKVGKTKLFLRYWHIDICNEIAKKLETKVLFVQKTIRGWLTRNRFKSIQQNEVEKIMRGISDASNNFMTKLVYQKNFKNFSRMEERRNEEISNEQTSDGLIKRPINQTPINQAATKRFEKNDNWPDLDEINSTLEEFDQMLNQFEADLEKKDSIFKSNLAQCSSHALSKSVSSFNNNNKISPESVYHLVHNNNNKNDNTLKKRNALVAFEFKTLLDKVAHPVSFSDLEEEKLSDELCEITCSPRPKESQTFDLTSRQQLNSPICSSSQSSSPSNNSSSSTSSASQPQNDENLRAFSPPQSSHRLISPINEENTNFIKSKSQILSPNFINGDLIESSKKDAELARKNNPGSWRPVNSDNGQNVTIWREQMITKNNVQQQIRKQTELCQKIEDSKKNIPEWKRNLLKQKEMKKNLNNQSQAQNVPETPELMKHNIFIKKGLATH